MTTEQEKGLHETSILQKFAHCGQLNIELASIKKCLPPKPDLFCVMDNSPVYFELARNYPKEFAKQAYDAKENAQPLWGEGSIERIITAKLNKHYQAEYPVQLLIYDDLGIALSNAVTIAKMQAVLNKQNAIQFEKVWYFAKQKVVEVFSATCGNSS